MLDHLFLDTVGALRAALDQSLLERAGQDDHLVYDLLTGDLVWETTVSLPGDYDPPRVSADISLDWQTWSQSAWRSLSMGEQVEEPPEIGIEVRLPRTTPGDEADPVHACWRCCPSRVPASVTTISSARPLSSKRPTRKRAARRSGHRGRLRRQLPADGTERGGGRWQRGEPVPGVGWAALEHWRHAPFEFGSHTPGKRGDRGDFGLTRGLGGLDFGASR